MILQKTIAAFAAVLFVVSTAHATPKKKVYREAGVTFISHPAGCPGRAFCGCGACSELGISIAECKKRGLFRAAEWFRFPRSSPGAGMAAVRRHHVFILKHHIEGDVWMTADYNSGGRRSRLHAQSIRGFVIVNPGARSYANITAKLPDDRTAIY